MAGTTVKSTEKYGLALIPASSGDVKFSRFRELLMGDSGSNMHKIDAALAIKGAALGRNGVSGAVELRDEHGAVLSSIPSSVPGEAFDRVRVSEAGSPAGNGEFVSSADSGGILTLCPGDNVSITVSGGKLTVSAEVPSADSELSATSSHPVKNSVITAALNGKLGKTEKAASAERADADESGNSIKTSYGSSVSLSASGMSLFLCNKNGSEISSVNLPAATLAEAKQYVGIV